MATKPKMKGIFKGFKYISQIFDEEKVDEIQIGFPTDVKHVAHIGWDGPTVDNPSWMKEFSSPTGFSAPLASPGGDHKGEPEIKWVSEDSNTKKNRPPQSPGRDEGAAVSKLTRRHNSADDSSSPKKKDSSTRPRSRRNHSRDSGEGSVKSNRESSQPSDSSLPNIPDPARKSRRKKSRELAGRGGEGSTRSRPKATSCGDTGPDKESIIQNSEPPIPSM